MNYKPTYDLLDATKLVLELRETGSVSVKLNKNRARFTLKLIELFNVMFGNNIANLTIKKLIISMLRYIFLFVRMKIFHKNLSEILKFLFACEPKFELVEKGNEFHTIKFLKN